MNRKRIIKTLAYVLSVIMVASSLLCVMPFSVSADTVEEKQVSRLINVVYDDSNSMLLDQRLWWCYAKYSMEVFSAMMQDKDNMNIYFMSDKDKAPRIANLSGDRSQQQQNIEKIHNTVTHTAGTPFSSIEKAYGDLKKAGGYDEKWLMVITDGDSFNDNETSQDIDDLIRDCAGYNIKVMYLAIGDALVPTEDTNRGIYVYKADGQVSSGETGILSRVTQICQRIFQRPNLTSTSSSKLTLDIPASEIIVFAQGSNASIGELAGTKRTLSTVSMRASDKDKATTNGSYKNNINIDTMDASIATFTPQSGGYIKEGTYDLSISADEYVVYYKPALDVVLKLLDSNGTTVEAKYIPIGSYSLSYWLTYPQGHPKYGEKLDQSLFAVDYTLSCTVDGNYRELQSANVDLQGGETTIRVVADYLNFSSSDASLKYVVEDFTIEELDVTVEYNQQDYLLSSLETDNEGLLVKVTKNGSPIPAEDWEPYTLKLSIDNPAFNITKNSDSSFLIKPAYCSTGRNDTLTGEIPFNITVSASNDHRVTDSGTCAAKINIVDDISSVMLGISIEDQDYECDNKNFASVDTSRKVTVDWNGQPLTKEQYDSLKLTATVDNSYYSARVELDPYVPGEPTTATVYFDIVKNEDGSLPAYGRLQGTKNFTVSATVEREGEISEGTASAELKVKDARTLWEILVDYWVAILIFLILLFLFLAYAPIIKRYLPLKSKYIGGGYPHTVRWYKNATAIATLITPFVRVRSSANLQISPVSAIPLSVKAVGTKKVACTNKKEIEGLGYTLPQTKRMSLTSGTILRNGRTRVSFTK